MPAYNPPPQTLFSPVSNYYQGKAIRQQLAAGEQDAEFKGLQIDAAKQELADAPARKRAANEKAAADYDLVLENIRAKRLANEGAEMDASRDIVGPWIQEYNEKGIEWANESFEEVVLSRLPENKRAEFAKVRESDGNPQWNEDEMAKVGLMIAINEVEKDPDPTSHQKHLQSLVDQDYMSQDRMNEILESIEVKAGTVTGTTDRDPSQAVTGDAITDRKIQEANHSTRNLVDLTNRLSVQIDAIPQGGLGLTGKGVRGLDEVGAELAGIFEVLGGVEEIDGRVVEAGSLLNPNLYEWSGPMANASAAIKSNYIVLAYLKAKTLDPGGRLAKDDVKLSMDSLGGDWAAKGKMQAALNETKWAALNGLKNYYKSLNRPEMFPQDMQDMLSKLESSTFGIESLPGYDAASALVGFDDMTAADQRRLVELMGKQ